MLQQPALPCPRRAGGCEVGSPGARCPPPGWQTLPGRDSRSWSPRWPPSSAACSWWPAAPGSGSWSSGPEEGRFCVPHFATFFHGRCSLNQCCGAGADRSPDFLAGAGADLKFDLEPEQIFWVGSGSFFGKWKIKGFKDVDSTYS